MATPQSRSSTSPRASETSSTWTECPVTEASGSDIIMTLEPLSDIESSPRYALSPRANRQQAVASEPLSPGTLKKKLFLQRLDRRGVSHDDPKLSPKLAPQVAAQSVPTLPHHHDQASRLSSPEIA